VPVFLCSTINRAMKLLQAAALLLGVGNSITVPKGLKLFDQLYAVPEDWRDVGRADPSVRIALSISLAAVSVVNLGGRSYTTGPIYEISPKKKG